MKRGRTRLGPSQCSVRVSLIALLLVEPVLRSGEVLWPIVHVEISPPSDVGLVIIIQGLPRKISAGFPGPLILLAHSSSHCAWRRTMRHHTPKCRAGEPGLLPVRPQSQVAGPGAKSAPPNIASS